MTYLPLAAFDPIFWLHHCNVDRMFALWQTVNPDSYGATQTAPHNTWTIASGSQQGPDSPLEPFRKDASNFWTTNDVEDWAATFSYTYPEFSTSDGSRSSIIAFINQLYGSNPSLTASSISENAEKNNPSVSSSASASATSTSSVVSSTALNAVASGAPSVSSISSAIGGLGNTGEGAVSSVAGMVSSLVPGRTTTTSSTKTGIAGALTTGISSGLSGAMNSTLSSPLTTSNGSEYQYTCHVQTPRYALNGSYYVYVFDGQPATTDASNYLTDTNLIGAVGVLGGGEMTANVSITGSVPLTRYLQGKVKSGLLSSMSQDVCVPYLAQNLNWKIVKQGEEIHPSVLGGFQAAVYSATSSPAGLNTLPQWSALVPQVQATYGKAGGLQSAPGCSGGVYPLSANTTGSAAAPAYTKVPTGTPMAVPTSGSAAAPSSTPYTAAASKASFGVAGVLAAAGLALML